MRTKAHRSQTGFSLIEAMVSLVVISVGMIGIASLYGQGLGASRTALFRTQAVNLAADMADRIRVNRQGGADYGGAAALNGCDPGGGVNCTPAQMPNGVGVVQFAATTPPTFTIQVTWQEVGLGAITHQIVVRVPNL